MIDLQAMIDNGELVTTQEAARISKRVRETVNLAVRTGELIPFVRLPGKLGTRLFRREDVEAWRDRPRGSRWGPRAV